MRGRRLFKNMAVVGTTRVPGKDTIRKK